MTIARDIVAELEPADGWWNEDTPEALEAAANLMLDSADEEEVAGVLGRAVKSIRAEYGD